MAKYETNPLQIRKKYTQLIRDELDLEHFSALEQKIVLQII